jgi:UDP-GlcNAc3NAcA epimerase
VKILTVVGARPQFVKAAPVSRALRREHAEVLVHTGQHYDDALSEGFFRDLEIPAPDENLQVGSGPHGQQTADMLRGLEPLMLRHAPDGVLVYGDTNSTLAGAIVAAKIVYADGRRPWLAHVEAGLRSFNPAMPEERNRIVADHLADLLLAPTPTAIQNLSREGLATASTLVGDVMVDTFQWAAGRADAHLPIEAMERPGYLLVTLHRAENVDDPVQLAALLAMLDVGRPALFPAHPRTREAMARHDLHPPDNVCAIEPLGYLAMVAAERGAAAILTDSGGLQKEAYLAGVPCLTLRTETEWTETVDTGWNRVIGTDPAAIRAALDDPAFMDRSRPRPPIFGDGHAADRIVAALEGEQARHPFLGPARAGQPVEAAHR